MDALVRFALTAAPPAHDDLVAWSAATAAARDAFTSPFDRAFAGGALADRVGYAFSCGYREALRVLVSPHLDATRIATLCATEAGGNHPKAIQSRLVVAEPHRYELTGTKTWATLGPDATEFLVVAWLDANASPDAHPDRASLKLVRVDASASGVTVTRMPPTPFVPEIPHASIAFDRADIHASQLLPGDGYDDYLKPFRTIEDTFVHAALLGYLVGACRRHALPTALVDKLVALAHTARSLATSPPKLASTHVALAGTLDLVTRLVAEIEAAWPASDELARWKRDRALLSVAGKARIARRERAWSTLATP